MTNIKRNLSKFFISLAIILGSPSFGSNISEKNIPKCTDDIKIGTKMIPEGSGNWRLIITEFRPANRLRNQSLNQVIAMLKLDVIEKFTYWIGPTQISSKSFEGGYPQ